MLTLRCFIMAIKWSTSFMHQRWEKAFPLCFFISNVSFSVKQNRSNIYVCIHTYICMCVYIYVCMCIQICTILLLLGPWWTKNTRVNQHKGKWCHQGIRYKCNVWIYYWCNGMLSVSLFVSRNTTLSDTKYSKYINHLHIYYCC